MQDIKAVFIPCLNSGVTYWRMYAPVLAGIRTRTIDGCLLWWQKGLNENHPWQNDITSNAFRARILGEMEAAVRKADVTVMGMVHTNAGLTTMCGIRECYGKPVVVEADDNVLSCPTYNPASKFYNPDSPLRKIAVAQLREADAVVVSTPYLKEIYKEFNEHIYVIPNSIDFELWGRTQRNHKKGKIVIGWVGGATHNDDLLIIRPAIDILTRKYPQVEFVFGHGMHPDFQGLKGVTWKREFARIDKYPKFVAKMGIDIGIAPLVDNSFNRAKSNLRWLEYSALGIPCVASNVGHFAETVKDGEDCLLCDNTDDFIRNLELLINDKARRKELAKAAYERVFADFNIDKTAAYYGEVLKEISARGQIKRSVPVWKESNHKATAAVEVIS